MEKIKTLKIRFKINHSLSSLFLWHSFVIPVALGIAMTAATGTLVFFVTDRSFDEIHKSWINIFAENIRQDVIKGSYPEAYRKCKKIYESSPEVLQLVVKDHNGNEICNLGINHSSGNLTKNIYFTADTSELAGVIEVLIDNASKRNIVLFTLMVLAVGFGVLSYVLLKAGKSIQNKILQPLMLIHKVLRSTNPTELSLININSKINEIADIENSLKQYGVEIKRLQYLEIKNESLKIVSTVTKQVAHDIRSPLSALTMITGTLKDIPEEKRILIRNATQRINDIANDLLQKSKINQEQQDFNEGLFPTTNDHVKNIQLTTNFLPAVIDVIGSEKRMQYREHIGLDIEVDLKNSFGVFAKIDATELKRVISNLVNNSFEALPDHIGKIVIGVKKIESASDKVEIFVKDNGKGIPKRVLEKLGLCGFSEGKTGTLSGSGLGIYHAKKITESFGGTVEIESIVGKGTIVRIVLPMVDPPDWFASKINLTGKKYLVSLDDDSSIHQIWNDRLRSTHIKNLEHIKFQSGDAFEKYVNANIKRLGETIFLVDYELLNQPKTGLDIVEKLGIERYSILVTSRYEEADIQVRASQLKLLLLPKSLSGFVPLTLNQVTRYDCILIDDDELVHLSWRMAAKESQKTLLALKTTEDFNTQKMLIDIESNIYIDSNLGNGIKGEDLARQLHAEGFKNLYLATGYEPESFPPMSFLKGIVGKEPPFSSV
ncbi:MAG: sensor histidine kinase [Bdellovibrio sp.]